VPLNMMVLSATLAAVTSVMAWPAAQRLKAEREGRREVTCVSSRRARQEGGDRPSRARLHLARPAAAGREALKEVQGMERTSEGRVT